MTVFLYYMCIWMVYYNIKWLCIVFMQLKIQMAFILHLCYKTILTYSEWEFLHATVNLVCVHWQILVDCFRGVVPLSLRGKNAVIITLFRTKARKWFCHLWGWFNWHVACALEARNLTLFQAFELFRCLIK